MGRRRLLSNAKQFGTIFLEDGLKSPTEKRVRVGPVLSDGTLLRAVNEDGGVIPERWDPPSSAWVRGDVTLADVGAGTPASGEDMEVLGCPA